MSDVWTLENSRQQEAIEIVSVICEEAIAGDRKSQNYLRKLWDGEGWQSIKEKLLTEGSVWYVWWMDGINHHICLEDGIPRNER